MTRRLLTHTPRHRLRSSPAYRDTSRAVLALHYVQSGTSRADRSRPYPHAAPIAACPYVERSRACVPPSAHRREVPDGYDRPEHSRPCAPPHVLAYARRSPAADGGLRGTRAPGKGSCQAALCEDDRAPLVMPLAYRTPRRKQNRFYAHARRLAG